MWHSRSDDADQSGSSVELFPGAFRIGSGELLPVPVRMSLSHCAILVALLVAGGGLFVNGSL